LHPKGNCKTVPFLPKKNTSRILQFVTIVTFCFRLLPKSLFFQTKSHKMKFVKLTKTGPLSRLSVFPGILLCFRVVFYCGKIFEKK